MGDRKEKSVPRRGKLNSDQRAVLEMEREFLLNELDCRLIIPSLRSKGILDDNDEQYIRGADRSWRRLREQNGRLLDTIMDRTPAGFRGFLAALEENNYDQAYRRLYQTLTHPEGSRADNMTQPAMRCLSSTYAAAASTTADDAGPRGVAASPEGSETDSHYQARLADLSEIVNNVHDRVDGLEVRVGKLELFESEVLDTNVQRNQDQINSLKRELTETKEEVIRIENEKDEMMAVFQAENNRLAERLAKTTDELEEKIRKITSLEKQIEALERENVQLRRDLKQLTKDVVEVKKERDQDRSELKKMKTVVEKGEKELQKVRKEREEDRREMRQMQQNHETIMQFVATMGKQLQQQQPVTGQQVNTPRLNRSSTNYFGKSSRVSVSSRIVNEDLTPMSIRGHCVPNKNYCWSPNNTQK